MRDVLHQALGAPTLLVFAALACNPSPQAPDAAPDAAMDRSVFVEAGALDLDEAATVIDHVTVVDERGVRKERAVVIVGEHIAAVVAAGQRWGGGARVIDGRDRFLVPGLADPHVHLTLSGATAWVGDPLEANLRASLYHGVLAVMDVGGPTMLFELRRLIDEQQLLGPTLRATGPFLTALGSHPCELFPYETCRFVRPENAAQEARALIDAGADALKVALADAAFTPWPTPRLDVAALAEITVQGVPVIAHVDSSEDVVDAISKGVGVLAHVPFDGPISEAALVAAQGAEAIHSTLGALAATVDLVDGALDLDDPTLVLAPGVRDDWARIADDPRLLQEGWLAESRLWAEASAANVQRLRARGAPVLPGSDAGYLFVAHGYGLQRELRELEELGWAPLELLAAATVSARRQIGVEGGLVEPGQVADLLLIRDDPSVSVAALASIEQVIVRGVVYEREALLEVDLLADGAAAEGQPCLRPEDCAAGLECDGLAHLCREACSTPYAPQSACGPDAWCMPRDAVYWTTEGVCHREPTCALYQHDCGHGAYPMTCTPLDEDTAACRLAGERAAGEVCLFTDLGSTCGEGLYCSAEDGRCYALCDPLQGESCEAPSTCYAQSAADHGEVWFGLCLP